MHYVSVMKIRKIHKLQLTNVRTLLIQVRLGPNVRTYVRMYVCCMFVGAYVYVYVIHIKARLMHKQGPQIYGG